MCYFEKGMIYMKILKKRGEEETKSMPHAPVHPTARQRLLSHQNVICSNLI
jgi:hypothetical protein